MSTFNTIASFSGILSCFVTPIILLICWKRNQFNLKVNTISDCGGSPNSSKLFNIGISILGTLEVYFTYAIAINLLPSNEIWIVFPALFGGFLVILIAFFNIKSYPKLHTILSYTMYILLILWCTLFHILILNQHLIPGIVGLSISLLLGSGTYLLKRRYGDCAIPEIYFLLLVFIWNLYFSSVIFLH